MGKYEFDARRYCFNNRDRMGHMPDGSPAADLIICEIDSRNVRIEALKMRLAEVEAQRDEAKTALAAIADSRMYGVCARLLGEIRDIAREALAKLEEK